MKENENIKENEKSFGLFRLVALSVLVLVLMVSPPLVLARAKENKISGEELWGEKSDFCGVLEIWNVDTFSGVEMSKTDFLELVARRFENDFKGVFVCVKNMKIDEFKLALGEGRRPNLISFGFGLGKIVQELLVDLGEVKNVNDKILSSGRAGNSQLAVGYIMNMYGLFSTSERVEVLGGSTLHQLAFTSGKDIENKKSTKHIYSLNYGKSNFVHPENAINPKVGDDVLQSADDYSAYTDYVNFSKSNILLGNLRDLVRLENKVESGDMLDIIAEPVTHYNDLIQYIGIVKNLSESVYGCAKNFVQYLLSENSQKLISKTGLLSTTGEKLYTEGIVASFENKIESIEIIPNLFS